MGLGPRVSCIIVNWNGWQDTVACLTSLQDCTYDNLNIIVVDNGSTNDSVARIKAAHPGILLLENGKNLGFAGGNNIGIRRAIAEGVEYVWLLNNDTQPAPDALLALVNKALTDPNIGAVASVLYYMTAPSIVQVWAGAYVNLWIGYARNSTIPREDAWFDSLYGASMLVAVSAMNEVGILDEGFFHYLEETELCLRLRNKNWRLAAAPDSRILHKVSASTRNNSAVLGRYFTTSMLRILRLHARVPYLSMFLFLTARFLRRIIRLQFSQCTSVWAGIQDYYKSSLTQKIC